MRRGVATAIAVALVVLAGPWLVNLLLNRPADTGPASSKTQASSPSDDDSGDQRLTPEVGSMGTSSPETTGLWVKVKNPSAKDTGRVFVDVLAPEGTEFLTGQPSESTPDLPATCDETDEAGTFRCVLESIPGGAEGIIDVFLQVPAGDRSPLTIRASLEGDDDSTGSVEFSAPRDDR